MNETSNTITERGAGINRVCLIKYIKPSRGQDIRKSSNLLSKISPRFPPPHRRIRFQNTLRRSQHIDGWHRRMTRSRVHAWKDGNPFRSGDRATCNNAQYQNSAVPHLPLKWVYSNKMANAKISTINYTASLVSSSSSLIHGRFDSSY